MLTVLTNFQSYLNSDYSGSKGLIVNFLNSKVIRLTLVENIEKARYRKHKEIETLARGIFTNGQLQSLNVSCAVFKKIKKNLKLTMRDWGVVKTSSGILTVVRNTENELKKFNDEQIKMKEIPDLSDEPPLHRIPRSGALQKLEFDDESNSRYNPVCNLNQEHLKLINNLGPFNFNFTGKVGVAVSFDKGEEDVESHIILNPSRLLSLSDLDLHLKTGHLAVANIKKGTLTQLIVSSDTYQKLNQHSWVKECSNFNKDFYDFLSKEQSKVEDSQKNFLSHRITQPETQQAETQQLITLARENAVMKSCCLIL